MSSPQAGRAASSLTSGLVCCLLLGAPAGAARAVELVSAWASEISASRGFYEYRDLCAAETGEAASLLVLRRDGSDRESLMISVGEGELEQPIRVVASDALGPLGDVYACAFSAANELVVVGRTEDGTLVAVAQGPEGRRELPLGSGGHEVLVYGLVVLDGRKLVMVGSKPSTGFVARFDLDTNEVAWRAIGRQGASLVAGVERSPDGGVIVCGQESGQDGSLFSRSSQLLVAAFDGSGTPRGDLRVSGRGCQLPGDPEGRTVLYETGEIIPGALHLLRLDDGWTVRDDRKVLDQIVYFITLRALYVDGKIAVLDRPFLRQRIVWIDPTTSQLLGSTRFDQPMSAQIDLVARGSELLVVSQPADDVERPGRVRIDAYRVR